MPNCDDGRETVSEGAPEKAAPLTLKLILGFGPATPVPAGRPTTPDASPTPGALKGDAGNGRLMWPALATPSDLLCCCAAGAFWLNFSFNRGAAAVVCAAAVAAGGGII